MLLENRKDVFFKHFPDIPKFRWKQIETAFFQDLNGWKEISTLPISVRETIATIETLPWYSVQEQKQIASTTSNTYKALLAGADGQLFETVLMANKRQQWTICVSSQIGCGMKCNFCATGSMGFKRNLTSDEIIDQYRYWQHFINQQIKKNPNNPDFSNRISNIVFMGMGEPLANYDNVKDALNRLLKNTDLGPTHVTVSTVGILEKLTYLLTDPDWPGVRIAISLHSSDPEKRKEIVPTTIKDFLPKFAEWSQKYQKTLANRNRYLTFEYTLINKVNDSHEDAQALANYTHKTTVRKINVIPLNPVVGKDYTRSQQERIDAFKSVLRKNEIDVTQRKTMGDDIAAACGQLLVN